MQGSFKVVSELFVLGVSPSVVAATLSEVSFDSFECLAKS